MIKSYVNNKEELPVKIAEQVNFEIIYSHDYTKITTKL